MPDDVDMYLKMPPTQFIEPSEIPIEIRLGMGKKAT